MKRILSILLRSAIALMAAAADAQIPLRVVTQNYPPYILADEGRVAGPLVDVVRAAFARMMRPVDIEAYPWSRALSMLESGQADALFSIKRTPLREQTWLFPQEPLLTQDYVFFVRRGSPLQFRGDLTAFANVRIGVVNNTSYGTRFDQAVADGELTRLEHAKDYELVFRMLVASHVDAVICSRYVGRSFLAQIPGGDQMVEAGPPVETAHSYLVFARKLGSRELADSFDRALQSMRKDGSLQHLMGGVP